MGIMAITMLINSWLKFICMSKFTMHTATCLQTSNLDVSDPKNHCPLLCTDLSCVRISCIVYTTPSYTVMHNICLCLRKTSNSTACI